MYRICKVETCKRILGKTGSRFGFVDNIEALSGFCSYVKKVLHPSDENL